MSEKVLVLGGGGHSKVVCDVIRQQGHYSPCGILDADPQERTIAGVPVIGTDDDLARLRAEGLTLAVVAVGDNLERYRLANAARSAGFQLIRAVHPAATVAASVRVGAGSVVMAGAVINADSIIEDLTIINTRASVDHDCRIGEAAHIGPGCTLAGGVSVGLRSFLGVGCSVIPRVTIGSDSVIGAGACVVADIPSGVTAMGVPARIKLTQ